MGRLETALTNSGKGDRLTLIKLRYGLEVAKNEIVKLIILLVLFSFFSHHIEFIFAVVLLMPIRSFSGGMHMKSSIGCFFYSLCFFFLSVEVLPLLQIPSRTMLFILGIAGFTIAWFSPVASYKRPIKTNERRAALKKGTIISLIISVVVLIILLILGLENYFVIGIWVVTLQAIQLSATWIYRKRKGVNDVKESKKVEADSIGNDDA